MLHLFNGSALCAVDDSGLLSLPQFVRDTIGRRCDANTLVIGLHENSNCLQGFDRDHARIIYADHERRRWSESQVDGHHGRARRTFGTAEEIRVERNGDLILPPMMRRAGKIDGYALFVGVGGVFEIWNPDLALASEDETLCDLANWRFEERRSSANPAHV